MQRAKKYVSAIYSNWFDEKPRRTFGRGIALPADKLAIGKILPKEGFKGILWAHSLKSRGSASPGASRFWMFDAFAFKEGKRCAIQITTSPSRQIRNRVAVSAFLKFFGMRLYVCTVNPDMKHYYLSKYDAENVPHTVMMTAVRVQRLRSI